MSQPAWRKFTAEQQRAAFLVDRPMVAAAGAGAGKTAVMAVRYVACLLSGSAAEPLFPERILAVSFTREAAGNLRARIERTLRLVIKLEFFPQITDGEGIIERELASTQLEHLRRCLQKLPSAPIATVDALCLQWVAEHAALLGRDPDVRPPESLAWEQVREQAWQALCTAELSLPHSDLVRVVDAYGVHTAQRLIQHLGDQAAALPQQRLSAMAGDAVALVCTQRASVLAALADAIADAQALSAKGKVLDKVREEPSVAPVDTTKRCAWLGRLTNLSLSGVRDDAIKELIGNIQDLLDFPNQRKGTDRASTSERNNFASLSGLAKYDADCEAQLFACAEAFARLAGLWLQHVATCAEQAHVAGFAMLEAQALTLLGLPQIQRRLGLRYRHILLDEAQDLNRLQGRLIEALQMGGGEQSARVFVVGDHRQSIYGFRHAEPEIFKGWETDMEKRGGINAALAENFRSHPDLLQQVRQIFAQDALNDEFRPDAIKAGRDANSFAGRGGALCGWRVAHIEGDVTTEIKPNAIAASEVQARHIATLIQASIISGRKAEDHAILLRTRSRMRLYAQMLERAGITYDTDFPGGLYDSQECHDMEAILRLCINPHDRRALAIALGGPWGVADVTDRTVLVECLKLSPNAGWAMAQTRSALGPVVAKTRERLHNEGVASAMRALMTDATLTGRYAALPLARRRVANLVRLAEEEEGAGVALDASAFIARLAERRRLAVDGEEAAGEQLGSRGVRLMTIHQAKGLEWPIVFLPDQHRPFEKRDFTARALAVAGDDGLILACHPGDTDGEEIIGQRAGIIADQRRIRAQAEEARLFYVACTRAQEQLHVLIPAVATVSGPNRDGSARCPADWLEGAQITWQDVDIKVDKIIEKSPLNSSDVKPISSLRLDQTQEKMVTSVTAQTAASTKTDDNTRANSASLARQMAADLGTVVHALLAEHGPGMSRDQSQQRLQHYAHYLKPARFANLLHQLANPDLIPGYWSAQQCLVEQPVIGERDGQLIQGVCDVLLQDAQGAWHLYDWKTGEAANQSSSVAQMRLYAQLLAPILDGPIATIALVDVEQGAIIPITPVG
jgi:ATP-dependent helicase/nuclease subunit A